MVASYHGPDSDLTPDPAQIVAFCSWWFERVNKGMIEIGWLDAEGRGLIHFEQFATNDLNALAATAVQANLVPGQACYIRASTVKQSNAGRTSDVDFEQAPGIWSDIDTQADFERAKTVETIVRPNAQVITGTVPHTRVQSWFRASDPIPSAKLVRELNVRLHKLYGGDSAVVNPSRLMRLPGTIAWPWKDGRVPELTRFVRPGPDDKRATSYPLSLLTSQLPKIEAEMPYLNGSASVAFDFGIPGAGLSTVSNHIASIKAGREWHNHMIVLVAKWIDRGFSNAEILGHAADWMLPGYSLADTRKEIAKAIDGARGKYGRAEVDPLVTDVPTRPAILTLTEFMATFTAPDYLIAGIIQRGRLYALTAPTGHGKTAVALFLAFMLAAGRAIGAIEVVQANVLFLAGENPDDLCGRVWAACQAYGLSSMHVPIHVLPGNFPVTPEAAEQLKQEIDALGVSFGMIIGDSLAAYFPGDDENHNVQMGAYARNWRVLTGCRGNPAVMALAHPIKNPMADQLLPRGGGAFLAELDANLTLWAEGERTTTTLHWQGKIRGVDFQPVTFLLTPTELASKKDVKGRPFVSVVAALQTSEDAAQVARNTVTDENTVLEWLRRHPGITVRDIATNAGWVGDAGNPHVSKVHRLLGGLSHLKLARKWRGKWQITEAGKAELQEKSP